MQISKTICEENNLKMIMTCLAQAVFSKYKDLELRTEKLRARAISETVAETRLDYQPLFGEGRPDTRERRKSSLSRNGRHKSTLIIRLRGYRKW